MSKISNIQKLTGAAAFGAAVIFSVLSFGSNAEAAINLSSCIGNTEGKVVSCCEKMTEERLPYWMIQSRTSCREAAVCHGGKGPAIAGIAAVAVKRRCHIQVLLIEKEGGDNGGDDGPKDRGRSPNDPR